MCMLTIMPDQKDPDPSPNPDPYKNPGHHFPVLYKCTTTAVVESWRSSPPATCVTAEKLSQNTDGTRRATRTDLLGKRVTGHLKIRMYVYAYI
jgi:hypothetical protein